MQAISPAPTSTQLPVRPAPRDPRDKERCERIAARTMIMDEVFEDIAVAWIDDRLGDRAAVFGPPDTSVNPLNEIARQLSTPGLYGYRPGPGHADPSAEGLIGIGGALDAAGHFTKLKEVHYYALGLGDMFVMVDAVAGEYRPRLVKPHHVEVEVHPAQPDVAVALRELRVRWDAPSDVNKEGAWIYAYDEYDLRDPAAPKFRVMSADRQHEITAKHEPELAKGWPDKWRYGGPAGQAFMPWEKYSWRDTGEYWHHNDMRGLTRGTLQAVWYATLTGHAAESASGKAAIVGGLEPMGEVVQIGGAAPGGVRSLNISPGAILYHNTKKDQPPFVHELGAGQDLEVLQSWLWNYVIRLASAYGISPSDITRTSANPTSGAALSIQQRGRREFSQQVEPLFRLRDVALIGKIAAAIRGTGGPAYPESGYSITYQQIPLSPDERREQREHLAWQAEKGLTSPVDQLMALRPGLSRQDALAEVVASRVETAQVDELVKLELERLALVANGGVMPGAGAPTDKAKEALNGAQLQEAKAIVLDVVYGRLPPPAGIAMLVMWCGMDPEAAKSMVDAVSGFTPAPEDGAPGGGTGRSASLPVAGAPAESGAPESGAPDPKKNAA